jgi:Na+/pantothenate symporter
VFYSLLGVSLFVPVLGGLYVRRAKQPEALAAIAAGVVVLLVVRFGVAGRYPWLDPSMSGLVAAAIAFVGVMLFNRRTSLAS